MNILPAIGETQNRRVPTSSSLSVCPEIEIVSKTITIAKN